ILEMKATYRIDFILGEEYILLRNDSNRYLYKVVDQNGVVIDEVRLSKGSKEFNEDVRELKITIESHKDTSKTKKYDIWHIKRCN
ncbi:MAG: hypothetical protein ACRDD7_06590, partial [Peptostreptococcaceae bacterium]